MTATALHNARVATPGGMLEGHCVVIEESRISAICQQAPNGAERIDLAGQLLLPGFIDVQVNGGGGRLFNDDPSVETISIMAAAHRRFGTTGLLPTLISDNFSVIERAIAAVDAAIDSGVPGVLGIHIEGPFLSRSRRGIHLASMLQPFDDRFVEALCSARHGRTLVTVAPECITPEQIGRLVEGGVIVSAGHSDARYEIVRAAIDAGMTGFTHLFNAMSPLTGREPGVVGAALSNPESYCGIIVDARHVHPETLKLALRCKPHDRFMLVTDGLANVGTNNDSFKLLNATIRIKNGVYVDENGTLAGSALDMRQAVRNTMTYLGVNFGDALTMASAAPARFLGLGDQYGAIAKGFRASFVVADDDLNIRETWIDGISAS